MPYYNETGACPVCTVHVVQFGHKYYLKNSQHVAFNGTRACPLNVVQFGHIPQILFKK